MKRQYSSSTSSWNIEISDEDEPAAKRPRYFISSPVPSLDESTSSTIDDQNVELIVDELIGMIDDESQTEVSDVEIIEIEHEDADLANEHGIIVVSDSESYDDDDNDQEVDIADEIPRSVSIENTDIEIVHEVTVDEDDDDESLEIVVDIINNEIIDLTDDEPNSANPFERKLSTDVQQCPICLETLSDLQQAGVYLIITRCRHVMCTLCCRQLLTTSSRCPLCRENVSTTTLIPYCILT